MTTHRMTKTPIWNSWVNMRQRCQNPKSTYFADYGARGITVCARWESFENFLADMGPMPAGLTLERKDNDGNYEPSNCCWATRTEQAVNRRSTRTLTIGGVTKPMFEWAEQNGIPYSTMRNRIEKLAWSDYDAATKPQKGRAA